tara:strand:+ start:1178 stop:1549 length:372 start_codon:yes stop_codon:yes gene_type:complete
MSRWTPPSVQTTGRGARQMAQVGAPRVAAQQRWHVACPAAQRTMRVPGSWHTTQVVSSRSSASARHMRRDCRWRHAACITRAVASVLMSRSMAGAKSGMIARVGARSCIPALKEKKTRFENHP